MDFIHAVANLRAFNYQVSPFYKQFIVNLDYLFYLFSGEASWCIAIETDCRSNHSRYQFIHQSICLTINNVSCKCSDCYDDCCCNWSRLSRDLQICRKTKNRIPFNFFFFFNSQICNWYWIVGSQAWRVSQFVPQSRFAFVQSRWGTY